ncbi:helix-turn-helix domain-containing protein [Candidatus Contubernalis alkaliaceticus]|uniref:helix-turn-helix domain-containing protein n=1 Tax=Candidatus Contubernalis alkaliaceticus TaxID=338645 RepID=UPI001F4C0EFC|nr:RodZ domain-containing protein [Candidatus Contubernalis alkalaceticus]UNC91862.1 helix-turn-helix domain-containing protein [Candidatus Contubernalis alkalaceticus]
MKEIGDILRNAREEKGLTYEEISEITKIQSRYLQALEEGDTKMFPGEVYIKGSLRNYARVLKLDDAELMNKYYQLTNQIQETPQVEMKERREKPLYTSEDAIWKNLVVGILVIFLLWGGIKGYQSFFGDYENGRPVDSSNSQDNNAVDNNGNGDSNSIEEDEIVEVPEEPQLLLVESSAGDILYELQNVEEIDLELTFTGPCWVRKVIDNGDREEKIYQSGEQVSLQAENEIRLRVGDPRVIHVTAGGLEIPLEDYSIAVNITVILSQED